MFYEPGKTAHGLPHDPFKNLVVPRPIGWISTIDTQGRPNLAPYSFYNAVASNPPMVFFAPSLRPGEDNPKDSMRNAEETGDFVVNLSTWDQREAMNASSASLPFGENEFVAAGLDMLPSRVVKAPRVAGAPVHLECVHHQTIEMPCTEKGQRNFVVFGRVVGIHIQDDLIVNGLVDIARVRPIARMGYMDYEVVDSVFRMDRPR